MLIRSKTVVGEDDLAEVLSLELHKARLFLETLAKNPFLCLVMFTNEKGEVSFKVFSKGEEYQQIILIEALEDVING